MDSKIAYRSTSDKKYEIYIKSLRKSIFAISVHKAGSVLFDNVLQDLVNLSGIPYCDFDPQVYQQGVDFNEIALDGLQIFEQRGVLFFGFRSIDRLLTCTNFHSAAKLILVRDPRDIAVSYYFSMLYSHSVPTEIKARTQMLGQRSVKDQLDINEYIINGNADLPLRNLLSYANNLLSKDNVFIFRYEDIIYDKYNWIKDLAFHLDIDIELEKINMIASKNDIWPIIEQKNQHIRQVKPGNYRHHLNKSAILHIESTYKKAFEVFGYDFS